MERLGVSLRPCFGLFWLAAVAAYYVLAIRTTGDYWAAYYQVVSVAPVRRGLRPGLYLDRNLRAPSGPPRAAAAASFGRGQRRRRGAGLALAAHCRPS